MTRIIKKMKLPNRDYPIIVTRGLCLYEIKSIIWWMLEKQTDFIVGKRRGEYTIFRKAQKDDPEDIKRTKTQFKYDLVDYTEIIFNSHNNLQNLVERLKDKLNRLENNRKTLLSIAFRYQNSGTKAFDDGMIVALKDIIEEATESEKQ